jgi:hypothetical protein
MPRASVHAVTVMGEALSLPLTFATLRAMRDAGVLPSAVIRPHHLVDEVASVVTLVAAARVCGKAVTEDELVQSAKMSEIRKAATEIHTALVFMFGPEETPEPPKAEPPATGQ